MWRGFCQVELYDTAVAKQNSECKDNVITDKTKCDTGAAAEFNGANFIIASEFEFKAHRLRRRHGHQAPGVAGEDPQLKSVSPRRNWSGRRIHRHRTLQPLPWPSDPRRRSKQVSTCTRYSSSRARASNILQS